MPWKNCPDKERAKVPEINLAIGDMANPCELAKKFNVRLNQLRAFQVRDGAIRGPPQRTRRALIEGCLLDRL